MRLLAARVLYVPQLFLHETSICWGHIQTTRTSCIFWMPRSWQRRDYYLFERLTFTPPIGAWIKLIASRLQNKSVNLYHYTTATGILRWAVISKGSKCYSVFKLLVWFQRYVISTFQWRMLSNGAIASFITLSVVFQHTTAVYQANSFITT
jgi:hypothetical protein